MGFVDGLREMKKVKFWTAVNAELLGTALLVLVACGACWENTSVTPAKSNGVPGIALSFGLTVATVVWSIAHISGGHINPAVTIGFLFTRKIYLVRALFYTAAQCAGAVLGAAMLKYLTPTGKNDALGISAPADGVSVYQTVTIESLITFLLVFTVFATCDSRRKGFAGSGPLAIGLSITAGHLWAVPFTGAGTNPARVFGPAFVGKNWTAHWAYWAGPLLGGLFAGLLYDLVFAVNATRAKFRALFTHKDYSDDYFDENGRIVAGNRKDDHDLDVLEPKRSGSRA